MYNPRVGEVERRYVMTKVGPGDYLLPSNDAQTIWRISRYDDPEMSGQAHGWQLHRIPADHLQRVFEIPGLDPMEWSLWRYSSGGYRSRREAVKEALNV